MTTESSAPKPFFQIHVFICTNERPADHQFGSCARLGSEKLRDYLKTKAKTLGQQVVGVTSTKCLSRCNKGPVMVIYPDGIWYQPQSEADIDEIFTTHLTNGGRVERLLVR